MRGAALATHLSVPLAAGPDIVLAVVVVVVGLGQAVVRMEPHTQAELVGYSEQLAALGGRWPLHERQLVAGLGSAAFHYGLHTTAVSQSYEPPLGRHLHSFGTLVELPGWHKSFWPTPSLRRV